MKKFFSYEDEWGVTWCDTAAEAKAEAQKNYEDRVRINEGIPDMNLNFCWGEVKERIAESNGEYKLVPLEEITDTDRLNWFLRHVRIDDVGNGNDPYCPGPVISDYEIEDMLCNEGFRQAYKLECEVSDDIGLQVEPRPDWEGRVLRDAIDYAIRKEREG